jgi:cAMP-dependent protein kinase regulator
LGKGDAFGEISLLYNSKRTASIIAAEKSDIIILEKNIFQEYIKEMKTVHLNKMLLFLESLPVFSMFSQDLLV